MGRTAAQFCSRESAYRIQAAAAMVEPDLTWQQQASFGPMANRCKHRGPNWQRLDVQTIQDPPIFPGKGDGNAGSGQGPRVGGAQQQARANANARDIDSSTLTGPRLDTPNDRQPARHPCKRHPHPEDHQNNTHDDDMGALPKSAYVPPHLRERRTTPTASASAGASSGAIQGAPPPSPPTSYEQTAPEPSAPEPSTPEPSAPEPTAQEANAGVTESNHYTAWNGDVAWDEPKPEAPPASRRENPRWPRTRGPPKKIVWPKQREMRPAPTESSSGDGGVTCKSDSNGDPFYDVKKLMDWNGDWLPPPEQWSARKGHTNRHFGQDIERWMNGQPEECLREIDKTAPSFLEEGKEAVPNYWIVSNIEQGSLNQFWKTMPSREPRALSEVSVSPPFWERYDEGEGAGAFIEALTVPDAKVDPSDLSNHYQGADLMASVEVRIESIMQQRMNAHKRSLARQRRPIKETVPAEPQLPDRRLIPESNVYFRPVQRTDVEGIAAVYNYYVENTIYANEFDARTYQHIADRIGVIVRAGLPFLVAVSRDCTKTDAQGLPMNKIVGFTSLDDYVDQSSMYRYTFELELYVHPGFVRQKIGSCLLDRLLEMANTSYNARGGYEWINDGNYLKTGPSRVIKTIMLTVMKENGDTGEGDYDFLKRFKFIRTGHIPSIGYKMGKVVDNVLYRHTTSEPINPHVRPGQQINYH